MIALLLLAAPMPDTPTLAPLGRQAMPARGCAAFLWSRGPEPALVAMATAEPARLRVAPAGKPVDLARSAPTGEEAGFGFRRRSEFVGGDATATLEMSVSRRADLTDGAIVSDATLTVSRPGADAVIVPVGGLVACRSGT